MSSENLIRDDLIIPAGTTINFNGVPFTLMSDTKVQGFESSLEYAKNYENMPKASGSALGSSSADLEEKILDVVIKNASNPTTRLASVLRMNAVLSSHRPPSQR